MANRQRWREENASITLPWVASSAQKAVQICDRVGVTNSLSAIWRHHMSRHSSGPDRWNTDQMHGITAELG